jgi:hypothetical protein
MTVAQYQEQQAILRRQENLAQAPVLAMRLVAAQSRLERAAAEVARLVTPEGRAALAELSEASQAVFRAGNAFATAVHWEEPEQIEGIMDAARELGREAAG